ncbi:helix-turn-helix transcriptional regulator [Nonomuraea cavernae]|uniref:AraC family transcriptional regulator n=1 Tax=Nonomuraea cavernae TaxID=2045107 RepID=A0A917YS71_9ACTN|nr:AraC family transcriptional regulator [Nonomuraea cavernae]MCA2184882.1 AraC family transcriptional regulator [Nonomuraea cavernae]GGO64742.1 AraC family transcriptional regulator [Nonomuraea cavernae]
MTDDWSRYWRSPDQRVEAMHAHFERHVYHRHSHETYSFGVTEEGAQAFTCRGSAHTSAAGMVMAFNPDDPHDGHSATATGFTYRMVHLRTDLVSDLLADLTARRAGLPLFAAPVLDDPALARSLRALHTALCGSPSGGAPDDGPPSVRPVAVPALRRDEQLAATVSAMVRRAATAPVVPPAGLPGSARVARRTRQLLHERHLDDLTVDDLVEATGASRFTVYRAFRTAYGMAPSDYQRQLRLRAAKRLIADGLPLGEVAARTGFADQSHLTRWFTRYFGLTPGAYRQATGTTTKPLGRAAGVR